MNDPRGLDALFAPRAVAVLGASRREGSIGGAIFENLLRGGFTGPVYPVNPKAKAIQSVRAYASVRLIPDHVDLAVIATPRDQVMPAVEECFEAGVGGLVIITAGFGETGGDGKSLQDDLLRRCRERGVRLVGPNCLGILNTAEGVSLNATFAPTQALPGTVAFSSQSGALGLAILDYARDLGLGMSEFVSVGNKADVSANDLIERWEGDARSNVILLYVESFGNPERFRRIASRTVRRKPIIAVKSGRGTSGARAASSHTGALAGSDAAVSALLRQSGVIRTDSVEELFDAASLLSQQPVPRGGRVAVLTNAGGPGILAADACEAHGLTVPGPEAATRQALRQHLAPTASVENPIDMIASATAETYRRCLRILLDDPSYDAVLVIFVPPIVTEPLDVADAIAGAAKDATKPVLVCMLGTHGVPPALTRLRGARLPTYRFPENGVRALSRAVEYGRWLARPQLEPARLEDVRRDEARRILASTSVASGAWLPADAVTGLLEAYGIRTPRTVRAPSADEAVAAAERLGFPVAVKIASSTITHKTEVGGVALGLASADAVRSFARELRARLAAAGRERELEGFVVQEMVPPGIEAYAGFTRQGSFGALLAFGSGGVTVELWRDVAFRLAPLTELDAREMIDETRASRLIAGFRGRPGADRAALEQLLLRVSALAEDLPEISELDINPVVAAAQGYVAVDARMRRG